MGKRLEAVDFIVIHCTKTHPDQTYDTPRQKKIPFDAIGLDRSSRNLGLLSTPAHFVIERSGKVVNGRPVTETAPHCPGHNDRSLSVYLVGGSARSGEPEDNFTVEQKKVLKGLLLTLSSDYPKARIVGHCDLYEKTYCPAFDITPCLPKDQNG